MANNEDYIRKNKLNIIDDDKNTSIHYAAALGCIPKLEKIIKWKQKIDPENNMGWTPLMMAVRNGNVQAVNFLLQNGADATRKNKFGFNVFLMSVACGNLHIVKIILEHLLNGGVSRQSLQQVLSPVALAILFKQSGIFQYLLQRHFETDVITAMTGLTPLMFAAAVGNQKAINKLIEHNADVNKKNCLGKTMSDILISKSQNFNTKKAPNNIPMIIVSPYNNCGSPLQFFSYMNNKGSLNNTPTIVGTPEFNAVSGQPIPCMFFDSNFTPTQFATYNTNE